MGDKTVRLTFNKSERLTDLRQIEALFEKNDSIKAFPLIFIFKLSENETPFKVMFSVPKKKFRHATDRNRVKRLMREAFRLNKPAFVEALGENKISCAILYTSAELPDFNTLNLAQQRINTLLQKHLTTA